MDLDENGAKGCLYGVLFSLPLWVILAVVVIAIVAIFK